VEGDTVIRGRRPDIERRQLVMQLRQQGLTLPEIGRRLGVSRQSAHQMLRQAQGPRLLTVHCRGCGRSHAAHDILPEEQHSVLCLDCLAHQPQATFRQRLQTHRLAAGLTRAALARRARVDSESIACYEEGRAQPRPSTLSRLAEVLGSGLLAH
jgi:transcriptional regulator with XRE-family HTH domain